MLNNPHLRAIFPWVSGDDDYRDRFYSTGGAMKLGHRLMWIEENLRDPDYAAPDFKKYHLDASAAPFSDVGGDRTPLGDDAGLLSIIPDYDAFWQAISIHPPVEET